MGKRLTDQIINKLPIPEAGNKIHYDTPDKTGKVTRGFGIRITAGGAKSFILNYRRKSDGAERRLTIGAYGDWTLKAARERASQLREAIDKGADPRGEFEEIRAAPTVADLCDRFEAEELPSKRASTQVDYRSTINAHIRKHLGSKKVALLTYDDIKKMHAAITLQGSKKGGAPYRANRAVAILARMLTLAIKWKMRTDNPAKGIERNQEDKRQLYIENSQLGNLMAAMAAERDQQAVNVFRLLLLTGARRGEVLQAKWEDFDLTKGVWVKPGATTKRKTEHRVPLSAPARQLLAGIERKDDSPYVFPSDRSDGPRTEVKYAWARIRKAAGLKQRIHDLRHSYASQLASAGIGLHVIGGLLGHTQAQTTHRYAHLFDDPLREATERVGAVLSGQPSAEVVPIKSTGR